MDFSKSKHPLRTLKNRKEYTAAASKACTMCHTDDQLKKNSAHYALIAKDACVSCHGSHTIKSMKAAKASAPENVYCLSCHKNRISMRMKNGETLSVYVDEAALKGSVHAVNKCADCHVGFSKTQHPIRIYNSLAEYALMSSELCKKCHADAYKKYEISIHYSMLKSGNQKAPSCVGCHGSHSAKKATIDKTLGIALCNKCHSDMYDSYKASIHEEARMQGKPGTPTCSGCHNSHDIESTKMTTKIKEGCLKCHKDIEKVHNKWLSNPPITLSSFAGAHFDVVSCAACHSKNAQRLIYLSLFDRKTGKPLPEEELVKLIETGPEGLMAKIDTDADGSIDSDELWNVFSRLYKKGIISIFLGKIDVSKASEAHQIAAKKEAVRECEKCHHPEAEFFGNVLIAVNRSDGKTTLLQAKKEVLNSVYTILPVSKFYALGSTNVKLFDILFIIALIGGIAVPIGHITFRIITSPLRSLRKMGKGGKK
jgi:predicted CXXCH cytochrome family protein